jgi:hypothetical protein
VTRVTPLHSFTVDADDVVFDERKRGRSGTQNAPVSSSSSRDDVVVDGDATTSVTRRRSRVHDAARVSSAVSCSDDG